MFKRDQAKPNKDNTVKKVELDRDQVRELRNMFISSEMVAEMISEMTLQIMEKRVQRQTEAWDDMAKLLGYDSTDDAHEAGLGLNMNWVTRELIAYKLEEHSSQS